MKEISRFISISLILICFTLMSCSKPSERTLSGLYTDNFCTVIDGKQTKLYTLINKNGIEVCITNYGGRIVSIMVPDKNGDKKDIVLGFDSIQDYIKHPTDFGATIGRYANRINKGQFCLDGVNYQLPQNNFGHCLHGGYRGFQTKVFDAIQLSQNRLELRYVSKDLEEGFPGNLACDVLFTLTNDNALDIKYSAETDRTTIVNMTNHSYFNLDGDPTQKNSNYLLTINADAYTPIDSTFMTTGSIETVEGTDLDFRKSTRIGARINNKSSQLINGRGYDHNWILKNRGDLNYPCAILESPHTGIILEVFTNEPGIQVYTGNFLDGTIKGKGGVYYNHRASVCLETQKYPDSPNKTNWPSPILYPGEIYSSHCIYRFKVKN